MNKRKISLVNWLHIRSKILIVNQTLVSILDRIGSANLPPLLEIDYLYGDIIVNNGVLQIPDKNNILVPITSNSIPREIINALSYQKIPLFISLKKDNEVFINTSSRVIPLNLFRAGSLLGLFETVNCIFDNPCESMWSVAAGARTIIMLPKITNDIGLKRLRKHYNLPISLRLKELSDHFEVFKLIASNNNFSQAWVNKLVFFTKNWLNPSFLNKYPEFKNYIMKECWSQAQFAIEKIKVDLMWEHFSEVTALRRLAPGPFFTNHAKHLINIAFGNLPSLAPTFTSQNIAPVEGLQNSIMNIYELKNNIPIIMTIRENRLKLPAYYSLSFPTILEGSPINKTHTTLSGALRALKILIDNFQKYNKINKVEENLLNQIVFEYIHTGQDPNKELLNSFELANKLDFVKYKKLFPNLIFPYASYFWNGCIRIVFKD